VVVVVKDLINMNLWVKLLKQTTVVNILRYLITITIHSTPLQPLKEFIGLVVIQSSGDHLKDRGYKSGKNHFRAEVFNLAAPVSSSEDEMFSH